MGISKALCKNVYFIGKGIIAGYPITHVCWKATQQCIKDIVNDDIPSLACKVVAFYCGPTITAVAFLGAVGTPETARKLKTAAKIGVNIVASPFTLPATLLDAGTASLETCLFGEALPLMGDGPFLLNN